MKYALVTGASGGIGKAIAIKIATDHVLVNYLKNQTGANKVVDRIKESGGSAEAIEFYVADKKGVDTSLDNWRKENNDPHRGSS